MKRRFKGITGEANVLLEFVKQGYEIFLPFGDASPIDMIVSKDGVLKRVSVKFTAHHDHKNSSTSWSVTLKNVGRLKNSIYIKLFDKSECDILAVFIEPENRVVLLEAKDIISKHTISIKKEK